MMKSIQFLPFLALLSCNIVQDKSALFQDALSAAFEHLSTESEYLSTQLGVMDPLVFSSFAMDPDDEVIRQNLNEPAWKSVFEKTEFDIEESINIWERYKGKDLSAIVAENHLHFLIPEDSPRDRGTNISFSAPIFNSDTSLFLIYMVFETKEENKGIKFHRYTLFGKTEDSWKWKMESRTYEEE